MNKELPPFYVGQKVVANKTVTSTKSCIVGIEKDKVYTVWGIKKSFCKCGYWVVDVGIRSDRFGHCNLCGEISDTVGEWWFAESNFYPFDETFKSISYEKVMEKESPLISVN